MLNKDSLVTGLKKADLNKIKKLEEALAKLKSGEERYYVVTKLTSIKSLCQNEVIRQHYCWYLFDCVKRQLEMQIDETHEQTSEEQLVFNLVHDIADAIAEMQEGKDVSDSLNSYKNQLAYYQSDYKKIKAQKSAELINIFYSGI